MGEWNENGYYLMDDGTKSSRLAESKAVSEEEEVEVIKPIKKSKVTSKKRMISKQR
jgi:hypothetical protein